MQHNILIARVVFTLINIPCLMQLLPPDIQLGVCIILTLPVFHPTGAATEVFSWLPVR